MKPLKNWTSLDRQYLKENIDQVEYLLEGVEEQIASSTGNRSTALNLLADGILWGLNAAKACLGQKEIIPGVDRPTPAELMVDAILAGKVTISAPMTVMAPAEQARRVNELQELFEIAWLGSVSNLENVEWQPTFPRV